MTQFAHVYLRRAVRQPSERTTPAAVLHRKAMSHGAKMLQGLADRNSIVCGIRGYLSTTKMNLRHRLAIGTLQWTSAGLSERLLNRAAVSAADLSQIAGAALAQHVTCFDTAEGILLHGGATRC